MPVIKASVDRAIGQEVVGSRPKIIFAWLQKFYATLP